MLAAAYYITKTKNYIHKYPAALLLLLALSPPFLLTYITLFEDYSGTRDKTAAVLRSLNIIASYNYWQFCAVMVEENPPQQQ